MALLAGCSTTIIEGVNSRISAALNASRCSCNSLGLAVDLRVEASWLIQQHFPLINSNILVISNHILRALIVLCTLYLILFVLCISTIITYPNILATISQHSTLWMNIPLLCFGMLDGFGLLFLTVD